MIDIILILRGISVLLVLMFHLGASSFDFGYIGVDMFFAISGYLMPLIVEKHTCWEFIKARTLRLYPAIVAAVIVVLLCGLAIQNPGDIKNVSISALSSLFFSSNFYFYLNTGYFDLTEGYQPLLHTWSLGTEYICYLIVAIMLAASRQNLRPISLALALVCGAYTLFFAIFGNLNYFDPVPRAYVFFLSFYISCCKPDISKHLSKALLISLNVSYRDRNVTLYLRKPVAIFLITLGLLFTVFHDDLARRIWPGIPTLLIPGIVTTLILTFKDKKLTDPISKLFKKIGDYSYSIYIWHWPIIILELTYLRNPAINSTEAYLLFSLSIIAGFISYKYIERNRFFVKLTPVALLLIGFILATDGASFRVPPELEPYASAEKMTNFENYDEVLTIEGMNIYKTNGTDPTQRTLIVGDSHGQHILPIYSSGFAGDIYRIDIQPNSVARGYWYTFQKALKMLKVHRIIFAYQWGGKDLPATRTFINKISASKIPEKYHTTILRDVPSFHDDPVACLLAENSMLLFRKCDFDIKDGIPISQIKNQINENWETLSDNATSTIELIDTHKSLCDDKKCTTMIGGTFIMRDYNHLNEKMPDAVNKTLYKMFFQKQ